MVPNSSTYASLVDAWSRVGDIKRAEEALHAMNKACSRPAPEAYTFLARGLERSGDVAKVEELVSQMYQKGIEINEFFLSSQLRVYANAQPAQPAKAIDAFRKAVANGTRINEYVVDSLERVIGRERAELLHNELGLGR